jgi:hypothetical protein
LIAVVTLSGALALAACGGGGGKASSSKTASGPTKAGFVAKADAICKSAESQIASNAKVILAQAPSVLSGSKGAVTKLASVVAVLHAQAAAGLARLRALPQPAGDGKQIAKFIAPLTTIVDAIATAASGLRKGEGVGALEQIQGEQAVATQVTSAAKAYGLHGCETIFSALG